MHFTLHLQKKFLHDLSSSTLLFRSHLFFTLLMILSHLANFFLIRKKVGHVEQKSPFMKLSLIHINFLRLSFLLIINCYIHHICVPLYMSTALFLTGNGITLEGAVPTEQDSQPKPAKRARTSFTAEQLQVKENSVFLIQSAAYSCKNTAITPHLNPQSDISWSL